MAEDDEGGPPGPGRVEGSHVPGEIGQRGIRGQASAQERAELAEEGIDVMALPLPAALKGQSH